MTLRAPIAGVVQPGGTRAGGGSTGDLAGLLAQAGGGQVSGLDPSVLGGPSQGGPPAGVDDAVPVGGRVTAGTPVLTVVDTGQLGLLAEVDETDVLLVRAGLSATVELDAVTGASYDAASARSTYCPPAPRRAVSPTGYV
ncbi:hypothetical protein GCM10027614_55750 [Micromonospora vulcania]